MKDASFQLFPALDSATEAALRFSIERFGVLVPVAKDQHGRIVDGFHRSRIAEEMGVPYRVDVIVVADDEEAREIARTLNADRRQLDPDQRRKVSVASHEAGHSLRATADALGVDEITVRRDVEGATYVAPDRVTGKDGKSYPARRKTIVPAKNNREAERAQQALAATVLPNVPVLDVKRVERLQREQQAEQRREQPVAKTNSDDITIFHGDFREVLPVETFTAAGATIITDPPYPQEFVGLWDDLARFGLGWGCDQLVAMCGQICLPAALTRIMSAKDPLTGDGWNYRWCGAYLTAGPATRVWNANVGSSWKPIIIFDCAAKREFVTTDVFRSTADDKRHHDWGQNEEGIAALVEAFTEPGDTVVDPFLGGGTTAVVCKALGRKFVGCDIDAAAVHATHARLSA